MNVDKCKPWMRLIQGKARAELDIERPPNNRATLHSINNYNRPDPSPPLNKGRELKQQQANSTAKLNK